MSQSLIREFLEAHRAYPVAAATHGSFEKGDLVSWLFLRCSRCIQLFGIRTRDAEYQSDSMSGDLWMGHRHDEEVKKSIYDRCQHISGILQL